jgi:hypothetical protein
VNVLNNLKENIHVEVADKDSSESVIEEMRTKSPIKIPDEFIEMILEKSELEISINGDKILRIWGASGCIEMNEAYNIQKYLPRSWAIGDDESGYAIVYSIAGDETGLYAVSFSDLDDHEKIFVAPSLFDFLVNGTGITTFLSL